MKFAVAAARLATPEEWISPALVIVEDGRILHAGSRLALDAGTLPVRDFDVAALAPGLVDVHVHGGGGHDAMEASPEALQAIAKNLLAHGVTSFCPTTVTAPWSSTLTALRRLAGLVASSSQIPGGAEALGIHLEGPFLSSAQAGVHPPADLAPADPDRFDQLWEAAEGRIALLTLAPELPGADALIRRAVSRGVTVALGHSDATRAPTRAAIAAGARHFTHTFNAMRLLHHRDPGILGEALMNPDCTADIIADGIHVDPQLVSLFLRLKGPERSVLISDAIAAAGCGDGRYRLGPVEVEVTGARCMSGGRLAGSVLALDRAMRNAVEFGAGAGGCTPLTALRAASYNPARLVHAGERKGELKPGADADLIVLNDDGELLAVMARGNWSDR